MKILRWTIITLLILFIAAYFGLAYYFSTLVLTTGSTNLAQEKEIIKDEWGVTYEEVMADLVEPEEFKVTSEDNATIVGWYFDHPTDSVACAVVVSHGFGRMRVSMLKYAPIFWDCGCDLVVYDHRAHNESANEPPTAGIKEKMDLIAVTEWVQQKTGFSDKQVAWMGESWGAATALQAGALDKDVAFIVADSPYQDWHSAIFERAYRTYGSWVKALAPTVMWFVNQRTGVNYRDASPLNIADKIVEPVFLIHSKDDSATAVFQSENIAKKLNPETSEFHLTNWGSDHVMDIITRPEEYKRLVHAFIQKEVGTFGTCGL